MKGSHKKVFLTLRFIPFVLTNGMNLFPIFILAQLYLKYHDFKEYILPLLLYYSFKTTILFLVRLRPIKMLHLLKLSIIIGILGSVFGYFSEVHLAYGLMSGTLLGICSGTLYPSYLTVQFHEKKLNDFGTTNKDQVYSLVFAFLFSATLFQLVKYSIPMTFLFLGVNLLLLFGIISVYPEYELEDESIYPDYSILETIFMFVTGFFSVFVIKGGKKLGMADALPYYFLFLIILMGLYVFYIWRLRPERKISLFLTSAIVYKGMLTNFIFVFCTFYQLLRKGTVALYVIYSLYLLAIIIAPFVHHQLTKGNQESTRIIELGLYISFFFLLFYQSFYVGTFLLSLFSSMYNQRLNQIVYEHPKLPQDFRLAAKYRLNNVGSILHQVLMMICLFVVTSFFKTISINDILQAYRNKNIDPTAFLSLEIVKYILLSTLILWLYGIEKRLKKEVFRY